MAEPTMIIVGGGLAGLSTGCYARLNGFRTHLIEQGLELGGVCTAWNRGDYLVDGCIHWLMGGAPNGVFRTIYEELGIVDRVKLLPIDLFYRYEDPEQGWGLSVTRDTRCLETDLRALAREDASEIDRLMAAVAAAGELKVAIDSPPELRGRREAWGDLWQQRGALRKLAHFRKPLGEWAEHRLHNERLRRVTTALLGNDVPAYTLPVLLSQLSQGQLSRPVGGSGEFRDAIAARYRALGGEATLNTLVEEVAVEGYRAKGVRLADGTVLQADVVVSTASLFETALRLLGGRNLDPVTRQRLETWRTFEPCLLVSAGIEHPLNEAPSTLILKQRRPLVAGDVRRDRLYLRIFNDSPAFAPPGHSVIQAMLTTSYDFWARQGTRYQREKQHVADEVLERIAERLPEIAGRVRMIDVATPLTFWRYARSWRGAYEGWLPTPKTLRARVPKRFPMIEGLYLAGQWVQPGGGVPPALLSGRHLVQLLCEQAGRPFESQAGT